MSFDRVFSSDVFRLILSAIAGYWLLGWLLSFYAALVVGGGVLLVAAGAGAWARENGGLRQEKNRLLIALVVIAAIASLGFSDLFYWWVIDGRLGVSIVNWFSFWVALAGIVLFYYRTKYQGEQINIQIREQIDDRFNAAVTLLGNETMSARLGAVYSLYHLAIEDEKYRKEAAQIMCSHVRAKTQEKGYQKRHEDAPSEEIQTAIDLLFRNMNDIQGLYKIPKISAALPIADLSRAHLAGADMSHAYLVGANFVYATCREADFSRAQCQGAIFEGAECQGAEFGEANCKYTRFSDAHCQGASFYGAKCHIAIFEDANCHFADFGDAECQGVSFDRARCFGADFSDANCQGAYFEETCLQGANFLDANCKGAYAKEIDPYLSSSALDGIKALENRRGESDEFKTAVFSGRLGSNDIKGIEEAKEFLPEHKWDEMQEIIKNNKGKPISHDVPQDSGMIRGKLEKAEIQQVIDDAKKFRDAEQQE